MKKVLTLCLVMVMTTLASCTKGKITHSKETFSIQTEEGFIDQNQAMFLLTLRKDNMMIFVTREDRETVTSIYSYEVTLEKYLSLSLRHVDDIHIQTHIKNDTTYTYAIYDDVNETKTEKLTYLVMAFESEDYYYLVSFTTFKKDFKSKEKVFWKAAYSIEISG